MYLEGYKYRKECYGEKQEKAGKFKWATLLEKEIEKRMKSNEKRDETKEGMVQIKKLVGARWERW